MNILLLAPHPFYQDRGTPIAVDLLLKVFSERGDRVDVLTYHEGRSVSYSNLTIYRTLNLFFIRNIGPGFSWKKLVCDFLMFFKALNLAWKNNYQIVHSVEESVFIAMALKWLYRLPYVYDMDSSMTDQLIEKIPALGFSRGFLRYFEDLAIKDSEAVAPVCNALAKFAERHNPKKVIVLPDVSLLNGQVNKRSRGLKEELGITGIVIMYIGNLEPYQGIDLLLETFAHTSRSNKTARLVVIGGSDGHIRSYKRKCLSLGIAGRVYFLGPRPLDDLGYYLSEADILVSPRTKGNNTPMKVYSYLHSGKALLATDLPTHTQVLNSQVAMLASPKPEEFSKALLSLIENESLRHQLGAAGKRLIEERFSYHSFKERLSHLYDSLEVELKMGAGRDEKRPHPTL